MGIVSHKFQVSCVPVSKRLKCTSKPHHLSDIDHAQNSCDFTHLQFWAGYNTLQHPFPVSHWIYRGWFMAAHPVQSPHFKFHSRSIPSLPPFWMVIVKPPFWMVKSTMFDDSTAILHGKIPKNHLFSCHLLPCNPDLGDRTPRVQRWMRPQHRWCPSVLWPTAGDLLLWWKKISNRKMIHLHLHEIDVSCTFMYYHLLSSDIQ